MLSGMWKWRKTGRLHGILLAAVLAVSKAGASEPSAGSGLVWNAERNRVDADIRDGSLDEVLHQIAAQTGWRVWVEPGTTARISTRFRDLPPGEALRRLLDRLNFALLPQSNGPPHLYVFRTSLQDATRPVIVEVPSDSARKQATRAPREWIVRLKPGSDPESLARAVGAEVVGRIDALNAYRLRFPSVEAAETAREPLLRKDVVVAVEPNYALAQPPPLQGVWSTSLGRPRIQPRSPGNGGPVVVALLDTLVQPLPGNLNDFLLPALRVAEAGQPPTDTPTHGTAMAQTIIRGLEMIAGPHSGARVLPVDVYGGQTATTTFDLALGIYKAVQEGGAHILNLSLGGEADSPLLRELLREVSRGGVLVVAAAGNQPTTAPVYPAAYPEVLAVTAGDRSGQIAPYANRGDFVDLVAPGASVVYFNGQPFLVSGTSAATAFVSGLAAGLAETRGPDVKDITAALRAILGTPTR